MFNVAVEFSIFFFQNYCVFFDEALLRFYLLLIVDSNKNINTITLSKQTSMIQRYIAKEYGVRIGAINKILDSSKQKREI